MAKTVIITCFAYPKNSKYSFNPEYVRSDLRRVLTFAINHVKCRINKVVILTDISPNPKITFEIIREYQKGALKYLQSIGWKGSRDHFRYFSDRPSEWLRTICHYASQDLGISSSDLQLQVSRRIVPILNPETIIEFVSLFTSFRLIANLEDYLDQLKKFLLRVPDQLFFYYTGHGVRFFNSKGENEGLALVIQRSSQAEYLKVELIEALFQKLPESIRGLVVFDCCHASGVFKKPYISKGLVFLASCREDQTCGFYDSEEKKGRKYGSLFTYFLISALNKGQTNLQEIIPQIEARILEYRKKKHKPAQNIIHNQIEIPEWDDMTI